MPYRVELAPAAERDLRKLPRDALVRLAGPVQALGDTPRPPGSRKVRGEQQTWRIRVGPFRVIYDVDDDRSLVVVFKVDRRRETTYSGL